MQKIRNFFEIAFKTLGLILEFAVMIGTSLMVVIFLLLIIIIIFFNSSPQTALIPFWTQCSLLIFALCSSGFMVFLNLKDYKNTANRLELRKLDFSSFYDDCIHTERSYRKQLKEENDILKIEFYKGKISVIEDIVKKLDENF